jgi:hypothetical protein
MRRWQRRTQDTRLFSAHIFRDLMEQFTPVVQSLGSLEAFGPHPMAYFKIING